MPKAKQTVVKKRKFQPAQTPEAREQQLIGLAVDLAAQQLMDGTASSQVITHFLKLGTEKERLEREKLQKENELLRAKTESLESAKRIEELYEQAIASMRDYGGYNSDNREDDSDELYA